MMIHYYLAIVSWPFSLLRKQENEKAKIEKVENDNSFSFQCRFLNKLFPLIIAKLVERNFSDICASQNLDFFLQCFKII